MKATGIIRRMDDLGRVAIPKEIRKTMGVQVGDALEIYVDKVGSVPCVCFAKCSTNFENELASLTAQIANGMDNHGEYELSDKFREAIKEAAKILKEFENRG